MDQHIMFDCPDILREFLFYLETIQGRSPKTVNGYYIELRTFLRYLKSVKVLKKLPQDAEELAQIKIDDVTKELVCSVTLSDIYDFLHFSLDVLGNSTASRSRKIAAIRALYKYLTTKTSYLEENPAKNLDTPAQRKSIPKYLTLEESLKLLDSVQDESPAVTARDYCMLTLMLNCGMRVSELVGIDLTDIRDNTLRLLGKGNKERVVYLNDACLAALENYLKFRKPAGNRNRPQRPLSFRAKPPDDHPAGRADCAEIFEGFRPGRAGLFPAQTAPHRRHPDVSARRGGHPRTQGDFGARQHRYHRNLHPHLQPAHRAGRQRLPSLGGQAPPH